MARRYLGPQRTLVEDLVVGGALTVNGLATVDSLAVTAGLNTSVLNAGTLPVARGGTGLATVTAGNFLTGNGTGAFNSRTPAQARTDIGADNATNLTTGTLNAARLPAGVTQRIATVERVAAVAGITTTETEVDAITADLVNGRVYRIRWAGPVQVSVADTTARCFIRSTNTAGTQRQLDNFKPPVINFKFGFIMEVEFTATSSASHTFIVSMIRIAGTGNISSNATAAQPSYFYVDYIRG